MTKQSDTEPSIIERAAVAIANRGTVELSLDVDKACCLHGICQEELAALTQSTAEPVAWRVRDFGDDYTLCHSRMQAELEAESTGNLIQPLYTTPPRPDAEPMAHPALACPDGKLAELVTRWEGRPQSDTEPAMRDRLAVWLMALDECGVGDDPNPHVAFFENFLAEQRNTKHSGDCNNQPWSCCRCSCDEFLEKADYFLSAFPTLTQSDVKAMPDITEQQIDAAHAAYDEEERNVNGGTINDCLRAAIQAALAQSNAEPVAWRYRYRVSKDKPWSEWVLMPSADGKELCDKFPENYETQGLGIITAPPRPDVSAGLIEAALTFEPYLADEGFGKERSLKWMVEHFYRTHLPEEKAKNVTERYLAAIRARAADRSTK